MITSRHLALIATLCLMASGAAHAITFGQPDGNEHPHVGTLLFVQNGEGFFSCTGTLISPTVMVTAGHCVEGGGVENSVTYVDDFAAFPDTFDVGLVILSEPVIAPVYGVLPSEGLLQQVLAQKGNKNNWWTAVGYGSQGILNPFESDDYSRYQTIARLIELNSTTNGPGSSAKFTNNPGGGKGGTCFGESGGPVFYQDTPIIGAIVSFGNTPCIGVDYQFRLDTDTALDFIEANTP
jgi:hypothetical protein